MKARTLFYCGIGACYFFALYSLYTQFPGLVGVNGLLPAENYVKHVLQSNKDQMQWYEFSWVLMAHNIGVSADAFIEFLFYVGMLASILVACGCHSCMLFSLAWVCFRSIREVFQVFTGFQWDILLLEVGFICILSTFSHRTRLFPNMRMNLHIDNIYNWCFRLLAFKLMFLAGVVKLQARCPTWETLSGLEYHFATQCLPTTAAWYAHQTPPILLRLGVASTLLIEIPFSLFLVAPSTRVRRLGCILQWLLQALIFFTGNYNYFNMLTALLMIPSWDSDVVDMVAVDQKPGDRRYLLTRAFHSAGSVVDVHGPIVAIQEFQRFYFDFKVAGVAIDNLIAAAFAVAVAYFSVGIDVSSGKEWWRGEHIYWKVHWEHLNPYLSPAVLGAVVVVLFNIFMEWFQAYNCCRLMDRYRGALSRAVALLGCAVNFMRVSSFGIIAFAWIYLSVQQFSSVCDVSSLTVSNRIVPDRLSHFGTRLTGVSSYGLFRRMTGVGHFSSRKLKIIQRKFNTTLVPSVVSRPEIILEGFDTTSATWKEIHFRYVVLRFLC
jgi:hypothetical protein